VFWLGAVGALCTASYGVCSGWEQSVHCALQVMACVLVGSGRCIVYCKLWRVFWLGAVGALCTARNLIKSDYLSVSVISICSMLTVLHIHTRSENFTGNTYVYLWPG